LASAPIRRQYLRIKQRYPDAIVLFRLGDFYETFDEDAKLASKELGITLTSREMGRGKRYPMAGIPHHALDGYLIRLINAGHKVAICEQVSDPAASRGLVERDVVRVVTPGTVMEPGLLEQKANNYLLALVGDGEEVGIAFVDITTGEFRVTQLPPQDVPSELARLRPSEVLAPKDMDLPDGWPISALSRLDNYWFDEEEAYQRLKAHFGVSTLESYGCEHLPLAIAAAGATLHYLEATQKGVLDQLTHLLAYSSKAYMTLDAQTRRNLELFQSSATGSVTNSLLSVIDLTKTAMGGRLLRRWLGQPLLDLEELLKRQDAVEDFYADSMKRGKVTQLMSKVGDLERMVNRIGGGLANPKEVVALCRSLEVIPQVLETLGETDSAAHGLKPCEDIVQLIAGSIMEEPPTSVSDGGVVREGFHQELDKLRSASKDAKGYIAGLERKERERTGIKSLKVGYNRVFGYYIEVSKSHMGQVPQDYIRKQTLVGGERFFTPELKEYESLVLNAQERIVELEATIFRQICRQIGDASEHILAAAAALAHIDVFSALAEAAVKYRYVRPKLSEGDTIFISNGRHPVVERVLDEGSFVPNDIHLSSGDAQIIILTGPNMSGKSTYLRQVALIVLMAQIGSFVPADAAEIGVTDRIFTRIGLQDDLATGRSTFMVEMVETATILNQATPRSLIILDEIGRGTSTYDGLSIARAVVEHIHNTPKLGSKTLFATHYHELTELAQVLPRVKNFNVAVAEEEGRAIFLHKIVPGGADKSYGIHVAQLAGLPRPVVHRAQEVLSDLEANSHKGDVSKPTVGRRKRGEVPTPQLSLFGQRPEVLEEFLKLDIDSMTPLEALTKLYELQRKAKEEKS